MADESRRFIGLMSGTSADAIDAVLIECRNSRFQRVLATHSEAHEAELRKRVLALAQSGQAPSLESLCDIDAEIGEAFARAARRLLRQCGLDSAQITAIGSHGQTIFHRGGSRPSTLQIGDASRIAAGTGITTVADFRRADIALGGQGAPLVPAFHQACFATDDEARAVLNIGGIANLSLLPDSDPDRVLGFDTGPGNALLDEWASLHLGTAYDREGNFAAGGIPNEALIAAFAADTYFAAAPPKSTGRGDFHLSWARRCYADLDRCAPADVQASFAELTARTIVEALLRHQPQTRRLLVCGGGSRNIDLIARIARLAGAGIGLESTAAHGLDPQVVEGAAFAWLAMRRLDGLSGNLPTATGARRQAVLGAIYSA